MEKRLLLSITPMAQARPLIFLLDPLIFSHWSTIKASGDGPTYVKGARQCECAFVCLYGAGWPCVLMCVSIEEKRGRE